jgi:NAD(P)-dependent dehydrogenase (short-subunit alcohol dehydrogenase family)
VTGSLSGLSAVVTGGSQGLGLAIARAYVQAGANVLICARDEDALTRAKAELALLGSARGCVETVCAYVSDPASVEQLVTRAVERFSRIDILVNNAGIYGPKGPVESVDWDEWERAVRINLFGSVLCCRALLPHFRANDYGKIIQLSGGGATAPLPHLSAYAASKAGIVRFTETLAKELRGTGIDVNAIAPGALNTRLLDEVLEAGPERVGQAFYERAVEQRRAGGTSLEVGARLALFLASAESDGITGRLISAVWDPWESLPARKEELDGSDVYTLRRIVPVDRGLTWEEPEAP